MRTLVVRKESVKSASWRAEDSHAGRFTSGVSHVFPFARVPFSFHFEYNCDVVLAPRERKGRRRAIEASRDVSSDRCWRTASGKKERVCVSQFRLSPPKPSAIRLRRLTERRARVVLAPMTRALRAKAMMRKWEARGVGERDEV